MLKRKGSFALFLGIVGAAFFFGDAMITPGDLGRLGGRGSHRHQQQLRALCRAADYCRSRLSLPRPVPRHRAASPPFFAPVTIVWFVVLGVLGLMHIGDDPAILHAFNPIHARTRADSPAGLALLVLGGVFLAVTGGEALYADLGHFGKKPIRIGLDRRGVSWPRAELSRPRRLPARQSARRSPIHSF